MSVAAYKLGEVRHELERALEREQEERKRAELAEKERNALTDRVANLERAAGATWTARRAFEHALQQTDVPSFGVAYTLGVLEGADVIDGELSNKLMAAFWEAEKRNFFCPGCGRKGKP